MGKREFITSPGHSKLTVRESLEPFIVEGLGLIPLNGKTPIDAGWTSREYDSEDTIRRCEDNGYNVGVRLPADVVVIDIDPRNKATEAVIASLGVDVRANPWCVRTGGGGWHSYYRKPADVRIVGRLDVLPGIDFKTKGGQVVAPGSVHPDTHEEYVWVDGPPLFDDIPDMPEGLLAAITRPEGTAAVTRGGQLTPEQLEDALSHLDPADYHTNDLWQPLMMSSHHATAGAGLDVFVAWSQGDPNFSGDKDTITGRWTSCDANKEGGRTIGTLRKELFKKGALHVLPPDFDQAAADFEGADDPDFDTSDAPDDGGKPVRLNQVNADNINSVFKLVNIGGKLRIVFLRGKSSLDRSVAVPEIWLEEDFNRALRNKYVIIETVNEDGSKSTVRKPLSSWWLGKKDRYTYNGLIFDSTHCESEEDEINLWRGFAVEPTPGDWSLMRNHIRDVIADGDAASDSYIIKWLAWAAQNPTRHCEVAIVFLSEEKGTGKGFLCRAMCRMFGAHGLHIAQRSHLVGKFNAHFMQCGLLFCDEVIWPGHKEDEGVLKALITEPTLTVEQKGVNAFSALNALKIMLASNEKWVVPASGNERRYAIFEVSAKRKQDHTYFKRIGDQLDNGGLAAMLHELLSMDLEGWHPRQNIPQTEALAGQKALTASAEIRLMGDILESGDLPGRHGRANRARATEFYEYMRQKAKPLQYWSDREFAKYMVKMGAKRGRSNGTVWDFPPLQEARALFLEAHPWWPAFDATVTEWESEFGGGEKEDPQGGDDA